MWERLRRFSALERPAQRVFVRAALLLLLVRLGLALRGFRATQRMLERFGVNSRIQAKSVSGCTETTVRMVRAAGRHGFVSPSCLEESLTIWWLLARQGIQSNIRIGIRREGEFAAHAWIELDGRVLNETDSPHHHYAAFEAGFPPERPRVE